MIGLQRLVMLLGLLSGFTLTACTHLPHQSAPSDDLRQRAQLGLTENQQPIIKRYEPTAKDDVFYLSDSAKKDLFEQVNPNWNPMLKYHKLIKVLSNHGDQLYRYNNDYTRTAMQTLHDGVGNCLSLTAVFYAYSKALGLNTQLNHVQVPPNWGSQDGRNTFLMYDHVNARVKLPMRSPEYVDFSAELFDTQMPMRLVSEDTFRALYFGNRAIEYMLEDKLTTALQIGLYALSLDPDNPNLWNNNGTVYRRLGHYDLAETAFHQAIFLQPNHFTAWSNLAYLYQSMGKESKAQEISQVALQHRQKNPYYLAWQARQAYQNKQIPLAYEKIKDAIQLKPDTHSFHYQLALIYLHQEQYHKAESSFISAYQLTDKPALKQRYKQKQHELVQYMK